ncbi:MAG: M24 family metallopeptidase [Candidatus Micrarchaeia archaeon]|jgi:Xaa-Pro dipeptidase
MNLKERLNRIFSGLDIDIAMIANSEFIDPNFHYLTGFTNGVFESNILLATKKEVKLLTSDLEYATAMLQKKEGMEILNAFSSKEKLEEEISAIKGKRIGINGRFLSYSGYQFIKKYKPKSIIDISDALTKARMIKDAEEIKNIRKAVSITKFAILEAQKSLKEGITELELAARVDYAMKLFGASGNSFDTIVAFGENTAYPHHMPDSTKLTYGDLVLIDAGAKFNNYCADITRTIVFGEKDKKFEDMFKLVKSAQLMAIRRLKPGADSYKINKEVRNYIDNYANGKYKGKFIHALGHGIGLEVHDHSMFDKSPSRIVKKGMTMAVEPGVYVEGLGGVRIEDDVFVDKDGPIVL